MNCNKSYLKIKKRFVNRNFLEFTSHLKLYIMKNNILYLHINILYPKNVSTRISNYFLVYDTGEGPSDK